MTIQAKAGSLYADIKGKRQDAPQTFVASNGWCSLFKNRAGFYNMKVSGEAASGDTKAAQMCPDVLRKSPMKMVIRRNKCLTQMRLDCFGRKC
jgi:hypothetical protein